MKKLTFFLLPVLFPAIAFGAFGASGDPGGLAPKDFRAVSALFIDLILSALPLIMALALLAFFWGLAKFILRAGDETGREEGKQVMKWGIVALFVAVSIWGILTFLYNEFEWSNVISFPPRLPTDIK